MINVINTNNILLIFNVIYSVYFQQSKCICGQMIWQYVCTWTYDSHHEHSLPDEALRQQCGHPDSSHNMTGHSAAQSLRGMDRLVCELLTEQMYNKNKHMRNGYRNVKLLSNHLHICDSFLTWGCIMGMRHKSTQGVFITIWVLHAGHH